MRLAGRPQRRAARRVRDDADAGHGPGHVEGLGGGLGGRRRAPAAPSPRPHPGPRRPTLTVGIPAPVASPGAPRHGPPGAYPGAAPDSPWPRPRARDGPWPPTALAEADASPYEVVNMTGVPLALVVAEGDAVPLDPALLLKARVAPGGSFRLPTTLPLDQPPTLGLEYAGHWLWVRLAREGQAHLAVPDAAPHSPCLVVHKALVGGVLVVRLHSRFGFANHTDRALRVELAAPGAAAAAMRLPAGPDARVGVPLTSVAADTGFSLRFAPDDAPGGAPPGPTAPAAVAPATPPGTPGRRGAATDSGPAEPAPAPLPLIPPAGAAAEALPVPIPGPGAQPSRFVLATVDTADGPARSASVCWHLRPPLVLRNLLPVPCVAGVLLKGAVAEEVALASGQRSCCYTADPDQEVQLRLAVRGHGTGAFPVHAPGARLPQEQSVACAAARGGAPLQLAVHNVRGAGGQREVQVYSSYWLANASPWGAGMLDLRMNDQPVAGFDRLRHDFATEVVMLSKGPIGSFPVHAPPPPPVPPPRSRTGQW